MPVDQGAQVVGFDGPLLHENRAEARSGSPLAGQQRLRGAVIQQPHLSCDLTEALPCAAMGLGTEDVVDLRRGKKTRVHGEESQGNLTTALLRQRQPDLVSAHSTFRNEELSESHAPWNVDRSRPFKKTNLE